MVAKKVSDEEFIAVYRELQSFYAVAERLGISKQSVWVRRKSIEKKHGITLPQLDDRPSYNRPLIEANRAVVKYPIKDGVMLVGSDIHIWPGPLTTMQRAFIVMHKRLGKEIKATVLNGDVCDFPQISRHAMIGWEKQPTVKQELDAVAEFLTELSLSCPPGCHRFWVLGNHDMRFESLIAAKAPEMANVHGVHLKDHFPEWTPCWRIDVNDDIVIRHRELGGEHADFRNAVTQGKTIVTGHDHRAGVVPYRNYVGLRWGVRCGFMGDHPLDNQFINYLEAKEPNWHPAFAVLTFIDGTLLMPELVTKNDDNSVQFRGQIIPC